jgi:hypothetical protein
MIPPSIHFHSYYHSRWIRYLEYDSQLGERSAKEQREGREIVFVVRDLLGTVEPRSELEG